MTTHRIWQYGDNINTDLIFAGRYTYTLTERTEMAKVALEDLDPTFASQAKPGDVIVGGRNWGNGSSREQAVICFAELGIAAIIAKSFARIYYRNAINNGLMVIACPEAVDYIRASNITELQLDLETGVITCDDQHFTFPKLPESVQHIVNAGGLVNYLQQSGIKS